MRRFFLFLLGGLILLGGGMGLAAVTGYYVHKLEFQPIFGLAERADAKVRRIAGLPSKTAGLVDLVDTTFLRFRGSVYPMPDNDFQNGGALTVWGDDVLVINRAGTILYLDQAQGRLLKSGIRVPDNGAAGYAELAAAKYPGRPTRIDALRYNDIEYVETGGRRGLLLSYTFVDVANECYRTRINWIEIPAAATVRDFAPAPEDWELLYQTSPCLPFNPERELILAYMAGGRMAFKAPNLVYLGSGDYHLDGIYRPDVGIQDDGVDYGKTIEINLDSRTARVFSKGHRNLQGVTLDAQGRLWTTEHGMRGGDELNLVEEGGNYGWPLENLGTLYSGVPAPSVSGPGRHEVYPPPVYAWLPSAAVSSMALVDDFRETWDGDLLIGSLRAKTLFRARIQDDRLVYLETIPIGQRIRDVMQVDHDRLALWLDTNELVILTVEERTDPLAGLHAALAPELGDARADRVAGVLGGCNECHSYERDIHGTGPSLANVFGREIAGAAFSGYTQALRAKSGTWDRATLTAFLSDPAGFAEGTAMTGNGISDPETAADVARALEWLGSIQEDEQLQ